MRRRKFVLGMTATVAVGMCPPSQAQQARKQKIGYLIASSKERPAVQKYLRAFLQSLASLGYLEGQNIVIEYRFAELDFGRLPSLAAELVELKVDVIVAAPTPAAVAAKKVTSSVPIIMINAGGPVGRGLVESLARPGGNVTGSSFSAGLEHFSKAMELLKEAAPFLRKVGILVNPANPSHADIADQIISTAPSLDLDIESFKASRKDDIEPAFVAMTQSRCQAAYIVPDALTGSEATLIANLAAKHHLPSMHQLGEEAEAGGLMSYGPNIADQFRLAAVYVDKILKGAKPADLPVQQPTKFELLINLRTARALGLTIPPTLLVLASEVIE
jgi:putative tryptophan/tyrosine transport system substrate-binding protein